MIGRACLACSLALAFGPLSPAAAPDASAQKTEARAPARAPRALLRLVADSSVVGHYKINVEERRRLVFDISADDPRAALLESLTAPRQTDTEIAATVVSLPRESEEQRQYLAYWLGYHVVGDEHRGLSAAQWDSIFQTVGRRAVLSFSPRGQPRGIEVGEEALRPVGTALGRVLTGLALALPADSVGEGATWQGEVGVPLKAPDGSVVTAVFGLSYRLRELRAGPGGGLRAHIEFDGGSLQSTPDAEVSGRYIGESVFDAERGRYEELMALAKIEVTWTNSSGLPPSRSLIEWQARVSSR